MEGPVVTPPKIVRCDDLATEAAGWVAGVLTAAVGAQGRVSIALSGGSTPKAMHAKLRELAVPWDKVEVYWGDERAVPPDDPASNYRMAKETLLDHVQVKKVVRIEGELKAGEAAARYADLLAGAPPLDVVLLGMGDDGHTASLFPDTREPDGDATVIATQAPVAPHPRVSLTLNAIAGARMVAMIVGGESKAKRLAEVYRQIQSGQPKLPAARVRSAGGPVWWLVDQAAASLIYDQRDL